MIFVIQKKHVSQRLHKNQTTILPKSVQKHFCSGRQISVVAINRPTADWSLENSAEDNSKCELVKTLRWLFFDCKVLYFEWNSKYLDFSLRSSRQVNRGVRASAAFIDNLRKFSARSRHRNPSPSCLTQLKRNNQIHALHHNFHIIRVFPDIE